MQVGQSMIEFLNKASFYSISTLEPQPKRETSISSSSAKLLIWYHYDSFLSFLISRIADPLYYNHNSEMKKKPLCEMCLYKNRGLLLALDGLEVLALLC